MQASLSRSVIGSASSPGGGSKQIAEYICAEAWPPSAAPRRRCSGSGVVSPTGCASGLAPLGG